MDDDRAQNKALSSQIRPCITSESLLNNVQNIFISLLHTTTCISYALFVLLYHNCITFSNKVFTLLQMTVLVKVPSMDDDRAQIKPL